MVETEEPSTEVEAGVGMFAVVRKDQSLSAALEEREAGGVRMMLPSLDDTLEVGVWMP